MSTTVGDLIAATRHHLLSSVREVYSVLDADVTATATTLVLTYDVVNLGLGGLLCIDDELVHVFAYDRPTRTATVARGWDGSTPAAHAAGAVVEVNARFSRFHILRALRDEIGSYGPRIFRVETRDLTSASSIGSEAGYGYHLAGVDDLYHVTEVRRAATSGTNWPAVTNFRLARNLPQSSFSSGFAVFVYEALPSGVAVRVTYATSLDTTSFASSTDVNATVGLPTFANDVPPLGAAWRLMAPRESARSFGEAQGEPRTAQEIPPGAAAGAANVLKTMRDGRISEVRRDLLGQYPVGGF